MGRKKRKHNTVTPTETAIYGKNMKAEGVAPAIALFNPKYPHNVGAVVRAASCFGIPQVWFSGNRVSLEGDGKKYRLPREERMRGYNEVELRQYDYFFDQFGKDVVPVAIELRPNAESLPFFEHPEKALYVFGPEDGGLNRMALGKCHRFVVIPTKHCTNLSAAVYLVLYDRYLKRIQQGLEEPVHISEMLNENRVWTSVDAYEEASLVLKRKTVGAEDLYPAVHRFR